MEPLGRYKMGEKGDSLDQGPRVQSLLLSSILKPLFIPCERAYELVHSILPSAQDICHHFVLSSSRWALLLDSNQDPCSGLVRR